MSQEFDENAPQVLAKCGRCCCLCRRFLPNMLQVHHIVERAEGGSDDIDNLFAICLTCHSDVHTKRPFTRRFTVDELKRHCARVYSLVAGGKLVPPEDDYGRLEARVSSIPQAGYAADAESIVIAGTELIQPQLGRDAIDVLLAAADSQKGLILMHLTTDGLAVEVDGKNLVPSQTPRDEARFKHAVEELSDHGFLDGCDRVFEVTHQGFLLADQLLAARDRASAE